MGEIAIGNLEKALDALLTKDDKAAKEVFEVEKRIDYMNKEITDYLVKANQISLPVGDRKKLGACSMLSAISNVSVTMQRILQKMLRS